MALRSKDGHADKGVSLARFPALVLGSILLAFGLLALLQNGDTPTGGFPDGTVNGESFLGFEVNGWTAFFTAVAGGLLLFGAAQHLLAKTMSLLVGLALGACSVIALADGDDVLGLAAANGWTKLGWGLAAAFLLINTLLPRKGRKDKHHDRDADLHRDREVHREREVVREPAVAPRRETHDVVAPASGAERTRVEEVPAQRTHVEEVPTQRTGRFEREGDRGLTHDRDGVTGDGSVSEDRTRR